MSDGANNGYKKLQMKNSETTLNCPKSQQRKAEIKRKEIEKKGMKNKKLVVGVDRLELPTFCL